MRDFHVRHCNRGLVHPGFLSKHRSDTVCDYCRSVLLKHESQGTCISALTCKKTLNWQMAIIAEKEQYLVCTGCYDCMQAQRQHPERTDMQ